jgi:hypothetical protein
MTVKLTRPQADHIRAIKNGIRTVPPLKAVVMEELVRKGLAVKVASPPGLRQDHYELTSEGKLY